MFYPEREAALAWPTFARFLPPARERDPRAGGRPRIPDVEILGWVIWFLRSGCPWRLAPPGCPARTVRRRLREWRQAGVFQAWQAELTRAAGPPLGPLFIDATFLRSSVKGEGVGLSRHGKGVQLQAIVDWRSRPIAWHANAAGPSEARRAEALIEQLAPGSILVGDKAYRPARLHKLIAAQGCRSFAPQQRNDRRPNGSDRSLSLLYAQRWRAERCFAWLRAYRRARTRAERDPRAHEAWLALALGLITLRTSGGFDHSL